MRGTLRRRDSGRVNTDPGVGWDYLVAVTFHNRGELRDALSLLDRIPPLPRSLLLLRMHLDGVDIPAELLAPLPGEEPAALAVGAAVAAERAEWEELEQRVARFRAITEVDPTLDDRGRGRGAGIPEGLDAWRLWRAGEVGRAAPALARAPASFSGFHLVGAAELAFTELRRPAEALPFALSFRADPYATFRAAALHEELGQVDAAVAGLRARAGRLGRSGLRPPTPRNRPAASRSAERGGPEDGPLTATDRVRPQSTAPGGSGRAC